MSDSAEADFLVHQIARDWTQADLSPEHQALCRYAVKLTNSPQAMNEEDVADLRNQGFCDQAIHDATQIISYFNYINRVADALNVDLEEDIHAWELHPARTR